MAVAPLALLRRLPRFIRQPLTDRFWNAYWRSAEAEEEQALGIVARSPIRAPIRGSERALLIETIAAHAPFESLLEVGCEHAQNFHLLPQLFPSARFVGIDVDPDRVGSGQELLDRKHVTNAMLSVGDLCDLSAFPDKSADLVISCAALLFIPPERIEQAMAEMLRVAKKCVILLEQQQSNPSNPTQYLGIRVPKDTGRSDYYLRDYQALLAQYVRPEYIRVTPVPKPRWQLEQWQRYACVVEAPPA